MKIIITFTLLIFSLFIHAQIIDEVQENPFNNGRINYFKKTIVVINEYLDTQAGFCNTTDVRFILPIGKSWNFRADMPLISKKSNDINTTGFGDFSFGVANIPYIDEKKAFALRVRVITDSSNDPNLGSGKWIAAPSLFYGQYLGAEKHYLWISSVENFSSFAGSGNRKTIQVTSYENLLLHYFGKNWIGTDVTFRYNCTAKGFQNNAFIEYGRKITPTNLAYIHPSIAFGDQKSYNYGLEAGVLILF
ncbi:lipid A phosphoethanolamine transferase [Flavobacterium sp. ANB]|uniref:lipid A phosphoethanolamine transferase n=1 Tax=unclassified Flavobacterium TaxID=196869 RepID=UPI0012B73176|nr:MULTISPECIES: lipid A phosphoethanolamine transferase [unclassified Flavobacterium]MBF4519091.1 lipid A phosphoethanolamine transferase [Flavobacterium sp. ANB]MTD71709.1 lipid A phosphoethanolamine transferase [Flavobacterium sp. LC2016-13]